VVTDLTISALAGGVYRLNWSTDLVAPGVTFYVYRDGELMTTTQATDYDAFASAEGSSVFEVFDDPAAKPAFGWPNYANLAWYAAPGAAEYVVEQFVGGIWVEQDHVPDAGERGLPPRIVVVQQGGTFLNGTYTLDYAALAPAVHRWFWTNGTTSAEVADGGGGEWLLRVFDATHFDHVRLEPRAARSTRRRGRAAAASARPGRCGRRTSAGTPRGRG
jgi:hypothetical protein